MAKPIVIPCVGPASKPVCHELIRQEPPHLNGPYQLQVPQQSPHPLLLLTGPTPIRLLALAYTTIIFGLTIKVPTAG